MTDVSLRDTVCKDGSEPARDAAKDAVTAHEASVEGGEGSAGEGKGTSAVVRKKRVGVLEESDHDEPAEGKKG